MKKQTSLIIAILLLLLMPANAQQSFWGGENIISPEVHGDHSVTFRVKAPDADKVEITGDWMPYNGWVPGSVSMKKEDGGIWTYTTEILEPELYGYSVVVDGFRTIDPNNAFVTRDIATLTSIFLISGKQADLYSVNDIPHGSVVRRWYDSPGIGMNRRITIYTPPGYETSRDMYPVLYLLHGAGGDEEAWVSLGRVTQILDNLIASGKARPMIVVLPNGNVSQGAAPGEGSRGFYKPQFMVPGTMDGTFEEAFSDVMGFVESQYRVKTGKSNRAIAGLSMGGFHSLHISRYYPNTFDYVGLFSPVLLPHNGGTQNVYEDIDRTLKTQMENGYKLYWIGIGKTDFLLKNVLGYKDKLEAMGMPLTFRESEGGHQWKNWRTYLSEFAPQLFQ